MAMWIVVAFVLGFVFGRMSVRGSSGMQGERTGSARVGGRTEYLPTGIGLPLGDPSGAYRLILMDSGANKINTIKIVRQLTRLGLKDAKDLVEDAPVEFWRAVSEAEARSVAQAFSGVAAVRVQGPEATEASGTEVVP